MLTVYGSDGPSQDPQARAGCSPRGGVGSLPQGPIAGGGSEPTCRGRRQALSGGGLSTSVWSSVGNPRVPWEEGSLAQLHNSLRPEAGPGMLRGAGLTPQRGAWAAAEQSAAPSWGCLRTRTHSPSLLPGMLRQGGSLDLPRAFTLQNVLCSALS